MAGYQTLYGLEAVRRLWEGQTRLFEMTDAQTVSADAIAAADKKLPALSLYRYNRYTQQRGSGGGCQQQKLISDCWYCRCDRCGSCDFPCSDIKREQKEKSVGTECAA